MARLNTFLIVFGPCEAFTVASVISLNSFVCVLCVVLPPIRKDKFVRPIAMNVSRRCHRESGFFVFGLPFLQCFCVRTEFAIGLHPEFSLQSLVTSVSHHANREASCSVGSRP